MAADQPSLAALRNIATRLRLDSILATTRAGSGHPSSCCSAAEIVATLFFSEMRFDPHDPQHAGADRFVLSKGHAAPLLYAAWAQAGAFDRSRLLDLRRIDSDFEGHPTPRLPFVDVATGSLGQGAAVAVGIALNARRVGSDYRTYVLLGDGECAEGSVWEAAAVAAYQRLDNLCAVVDVNGFGQTGETPSGRDTGALTARWRAFGWHAIGVDGHDVRGLIAAFAEARGVEGCPTVVLARTIKGKGVSAMAGQGGWHGRALKPAELPAALEELGAQFVDGPGSSPDGPSPVEVRRPPAIARPEPSCRPVAPPAYRPGDEIATREAYGTALAKLVDADARVVVLDADVKNSTFSERAETVHPERFYQNFIAEQVMLGSAMGLASRGAIPFPSTFACFLTRACDFVRMAAVSGLNVKMAGSHAGVSIGEDGPSQMGLEDLAMMRAQPGVTVLYPCDAVSTERLVVLAARTPGPVYIRLTRPRTPVIYPADETFAAGGCKVLRHSPADAVTIVAAGVTVFEALKAHERLAQAGVAVRVIDAYSVQPVDGAALLEAAHRTGGRLITVEDHYAAGGLGDAVATAVGADGIRVRRLAVGGVPRSGRPEELLERFGIGASGIVEAVMAFLPA